MAIVTFRSESILREGLSVENRAGKFTVLMDEPETLRGTDTGMNPVEMLLCCLGACQCIVARLFARARKIQVQDFRVELEGDLDPDGFLRVKDGFRAGLHEIRYTVHIRTDATRVKSGNSSSS
ncbi:MAG: OsmC-like protein [Syntrophaceae bacterium PtaU1.Bin231]|nr:MAG: OsmC-like protein [Syntrophaceae bacterium PtaU1.Bin231]